MLLLWGCDQRVKQQQRLGPLGWGVSPSSVAVSARRLENQLAMI